MHIYCTFPAFQTASKVIWHWLIWTPWWEGGAVGGILQIWQCVENLTRWHLTLSGVKIDPTYIARKHMCIFSMWEKGNISVVPLPFCMDILLCIVAHRSVHVTMELNLTNTWSGKYIYHEYSWRIIAHDQNWTWLGWIRKDSSYSD